MAKTNTVEIIKPAKLTLLSNKTDFSKYPELEKLVTQTTETISDLKRNFVKIGFLLIEIKSNKNLQDIFGWEKGRPFKDIYEFSKQEFKLSKTATSVFMGIASRFGELKERLQKKFEPYNQTQLEVMLPLSDTQIELVNPDMTVEEIKALKKVQKEVRLTEQKNKSIEKNTFEQGTVLKNDKQRLDFFENYQDWGVWLKVPELNMKFYKCMFNNNDYALVTEVAYSAKKYGKSEEETFYRKHFQIIRSGTKKDVYYLGQSCIYSFSAYSGSDICSYFKETKAKVLFDYVEKENKK